MNFNKKVSILRIIKISAETHHNLGAKNTLGFSVLFTPIFTNIIGC